MSSELTDCLPLSSLVLFLGGIAQSDSAYCNTCYRSVVCPSVNMSMSYSCTLLKPLHGMTCHLADHMVPSDIVSDKGSAPPPLKGRRDLGVGCRIAKLLWRSLALVSIFRRLAYYGPAQALFLPDFSCSLDLLKRSYQFVTILYHKCKFVRVFVFYGFNLHSSIGIT